MKKIRKGLLSSWLWMGILSSFAQKTPSLVVSIQSTDTQAPLKGCTVQLYPGNLLFSSDSSGRCLIFDLPLGRYYAIIQKEGFKTIISETILIQAHQSHHVTILLPESTIQLPPVHILGQALLTTNEPTNPFAFLSARSFTPEETDRYPMALQDPARAALSFAGVQGGRNDLENPIIVRGNSPFGVSWRVEGMDIPNPNHFAKHGASGGGVSIFSSQVTGRSDFYSGAMPAEFGNALSATFDMTLREGNNQSTHYKVRSSFIGLDVSAEGPIQKSKSSFLMNYRYSTLGILNWLLFYLGEYRKVNTFSDLSFHLVFHGPNKKYKTSFFGVGGKSLDRAFPEEIAVNRDPTDIDDWEDRIRLSSMRATGIIHKRSLSPRSSLALSLAYTQSSIRRWSDTLSSLNERLRYTTENYIDNRLIAQITLQHRFNDRFLFKTGSQWQGMDFFFQRSIINKRMWKRTDHLEENLFVNGIGRSVISNSYAMLQTRLGNHALLNTGMHYTHFFFNQTKALEPRVSLKFTPNSLHVFAVSFGKHSQLLPLSTYFVSQVDRSSSATRLIYPNMTLAFPRSTHWVISHRFLITHDVKITTELYYQNQHRVLVQSGYQNPFWMLNYADGYPEATDLSATGRGFSRGIDLTIEKIFFQRYYLLLAGSLNQAKFNPYANQWFPSNFDDRFSSALTTGREFKLKKNRLLQGGLRVIVNGGARYSPPNINKSQNAGTYIPDIDQFNRLYAPPYRRLDSRIAYIYTKTRHAGQIALDIQNLTNYANISRIQYNPQNQNMNLLRKGTGFTPILSFHSTF